MTVPCFADYTLCASSESAPMLRDLMDDGRYWFHNFQFSNGVAGGGWDPSSKKLYHLCLPNQLNGLTVLDVGAYEGFFSFHMKQRGADRVVAADEYVWTAPESPAKLHFGGVRKALNSDVEDIATSVENLSLNINTKFDIVLFMGVLYHSPNMIEYLKQVASVTKTVCVIETHLDMLQVEAPAAEFYPPFTVNNDASNWWGPNIAAVVHMCQRAGFSNVSFINFWDINPLEQIRGGSQWGAVRTARGVFYAYP